MSTKKFIGATVLMLCLLILISPNVWAEMCSADCNCDGTVNLTDLVTMKQEYFRNNCDPCCTRHGLTECDNVCVNTDTDENHCGSCSNSCLTDEMCVGGNCVHIIKITCEGTLSPLGRWCDQGDGTVKDMTTGLVWCKNAGCWQEHLPWHVTYPDVWDCYSLPLRIERHFCDGCRHDCNFSDGSVRGEWRLPTLAELWHIRIGAEGIRSYSPYFFTDVISTYYWTNTTYADNRDKVWTVHIDDATPNPWPMSMDYVGALPWAVRNDR